MTARDLRGARRFFARSALVRAHARVRRDPIRLFLPDFLLLE